MPSIKQRTDSYTSYLWNKYILPGRQYLIEKKHRSVDEIFHIASSQKWENILTVYPEGEIRVYTTNNNSSTNGVIPDGWSELATSNEKNLHHPWCDGYPPMSKEELLITLRRELGIDC